MEHLMSSPTILISTILPPGILQYLKEKCPNANYIEYPDISKNRDKFLNIVKSNRFDGIYCTLATKGIDKEIIDAAGSQLKVISTMSVGYDHIDIGACTKNKVKVGFTPGVLTDTTADLSLALCLATTRKLPSAIKSAKEGTWGTWTPMGYTGKDLFGSKVGIVGFGRIGKAVARRCIGFGCSIMYHNPTEKSVDAAKINAQYVTFDELLNLSDFIFVCARYTSQTHHLFNKNAFKKMKRDSVFINTARGQIVDQDALYSALKNNEILAAGLDVTHPEPLPTEHPLFSLTNCVILPHIGSASTATRISMGYITADNLLIGLGFDVKNKDGQITKPFFV